MAEYIEQETVINRLFDMEKLVKKENTIDAIICAGIVHCCIDAVKEAPTADVVEVRHGRWIYEHGDPAMMPCSVCGYQVFRYNNTHYCPNCGAKMDRGANRLEIDTVKDGGVNDGKA